MRVVGLITEYNPFHNGHLHHLRESLRSAAADASVAVMSGHFLQRGEPALVDKWARAEMALAAGVDLVLELPFPFACNSAPHFAAGAVQSLNALGVVDALCFGSEAGELTALQQIADVLINHQSGIAVETSAMLREGVNYPTARARALAKYLPGQSAEAAASPNNILGIEYLRALRLSGSPIKPETIQRVGAGYHATEVISNIASATGIRKKIADGENVDLLLPEACLAILKGSLKPGHCLDTEKFFAILQSLLLQEPETLQGLYHVADGLDARLREAAMTAVSFADLAATVKSRHWTLTRIQRILCYVLMQAKGDEMQGFLESGPLYLRLLGAKERGRQILAEARKKRSLPIIDDPARSANVLRRFYAEDADRAGLAEKMLDYDLRATRLYGLLLKMPRKGHRNRDFFVRI